MCVNNCQGDDTLNLPKEVRKSEPYRRDNLSNWNIVTKTGDIEGRVLTQKNSKRQRKLLTKK